MSQSHTQFNTPATSLIQGGYSRVCDNKTKGVVYI